MLAASHPATAAPPCPTPEEPPLTQCHIDELLVGSQFSVPRSAFRVQKAATHRRPDTPQRTQPYVLIPDGLIEAHVRDPLAVGVYIAIARLVLIRRGAVPLSAADLAAWIGCSDDAGQVAMMRRILKLERSGWLVITRSRSRKHTLLPSWGSDRDGTPRPWDFDQAATGRPNHLRGRRVPVALLDSTLGQLKPQDGSAPALISRYLTHALLDLADIGMFAIRMRTIKEPTPRLAHLGLTSEVLPGIQELLETAAAGTLTTLRGDGTPIGVGLTAWGYDQLGIDPPAAWAGRSLELRDLTDVSALPDAANPIFQPPHSHNALDAGIAPPPPAEGVCGSPLSRDLAGVSALPDAANHTSQASHSHNDSDAGVALPSPAEGVCRSISGSTRRSPKPRDPAGIFALPDAENPTFIPSNARNTWDVGIMESINHDSPSNVIDRAGGGGQLTPIRESREPRAPEGTQPADNRVSPERPQLALGACDRNHVAPARLAPEIIASHQALNPDRVIFPGEWWELLALQQTHGAEQLLTWQARAVRRSTGAPSAVHPGYYTACAARSALDAYRPRRRDVPPSQEGVTTPDMEFVAPAQVPRPVPTPAPALDPACDALLREMGIREREPLTGVPLALIQQWAEVVDHAGLAARFDDPRAFAHHQLRAGHAPPSRAELDRWARIARKRAAAESPPALTDEQVAAIRTRAAAIEARAAAIAPDDLTKDERLGLLADLERGGSDTEALDLLHARRAEAVRLAERTPEQICAELVADLQTPFHHRLWPLLERISLAVEGDTLKLVCKQGGDVGTVQAQLAPIVRAFLSRTHWQPEVRVVAYTPPPPPKEAPPAPPDWITPHLWATLPGLMRTALLGSTLEDGELRCKAPTLTDLVRTRFGRELAALLAEVRDGH